MEMNINDVHRHETHGLVSGGAWLDRTGGWSGHVFGRSVSSIFCEVSLISLLTPCLVRLSYSRIWFAIHYFEPDKPQKADALDWFISS